MRKKANRLAVDYYNICVIGVDLLYEVSYVDPGAIEDLADFARQFIERTGKRTAKLSARTLEDLHEATKRMIAAPAPPDPKEP